ncbi:hypothetical protein N9P60_00220 [bacterium]|nr:hypothetical protein [bacterium]MDB4319852.1 hypothetical protein [bacterium]
MKQKTLQEQYNLIKEGKGNAIAFIKASKRQFPAQIRNSAGLTETINSLKHNHIISENVWGVATESDKTPDWFSIFDKNMEIIAEETKAIEKKTSQEVEDIQSSGYDYSDEKNIDNIYGEEFLTGYYAEMKDPKNIDKTVEELKKIVAKNLTKDKLHYVKDGQFGVKGLGYEEKEMEEVSGKHKSSGYSDKLKKSENKDILVKESINKTLNEAFSRMASDTVENELYVATQRLSDYYDWLKAGNDSGKGDTLDNVISLLKKCKRMIKRFDNKEETIGTEYEASAFEPVVTEKFKFSKKEVVKESINKTLNEAKRAGLSKEETLKVAQKFADALTKLDGMKYTVSSDYEEDSFDLDIEDQDDVDPRITGEYAGGSYNINDDGSVVNMATWNRKTNVSPTYGNMDDDIETIINTIKNLSESVVKESYTEFQRDGVEKGEKIEKKKMKKTKKETIDTKLSEIEKAGRITTLEAQIDALSEVIESKNQRISMVSEDENMSELVDKAKVKGMQKEIKLLEKRKMKMEKLYEKMCGKSYSKSGVIDEDSVNEIGMFNDPRSSGNFDHLTSNGDDEPSEEYMEVKLKAEDRVDAGEEVEDVVKDYPKFSEMLLQDLGLKYGM